MTCLICLMSLQEPQQKKGFTSLFVRTSSSGLPAEEQRQGEGPARPRPARLYAARLAGDVKKALSGGSKKAEAAAAEAAAKVRKSPPTQRHHCC